MTGAPMGPRMSSISGTPGVHDGQPTTGQGSVDGAVAAAPRWRITAAARMARAPASWSGTSVSPRSSGREDDADHGLDQHQDPGTGPTDRADPAEERDRGDRRGEDPGEHEQGQDRRRRAADTRASRRRPATIARSDAPTRSEQDQGHRLVGGDIRVAVTAHDDEHGLAERCAQGEGHPDRVEDDARCRIQLEATTAIIPSSANPSAAARDASSCSRPSARFTIATIAG